MDTDNLTQFDERLLKVWLQEMKTTPIRHPAPLLEVDALSFMYKVKTVLQLEHHIFLMAVQVLEEYIRKKDEKDVNINDPAMSIFCALFLSAKFCGKTKGHKLDLKKIKHYLFIYTGKCYNNSGIIAAEIDMLKTLFYCLPTFTKIDDLNTLYMIFVHPLIVRKDVNELCLEIFNFTILAWPNIYQEVKAVYSGTSMKDAAFKELSSHRCYIPCAVIITAMNLLNMFRVHDKSKMLKQLFSLTAIHFDHIEFLSDIIYKLIKKNIKK